MPPHFQESKVYKVNRGTADRLLRKLTLEIVSIVSVELQPRQKLTIELDLPSTVGDAEFLTELQSGDWVKVVYSAEGKWQLPPPK